MESPDTTEDRWPLIDSDPAPRRVRDDDYTVCAPEMEKPCPSVTELDANRQRRLFNVLARTKSTFKACESVHVPQRLFWNLKANNMEFARMVDEALDTPDIEEAMSDDDVTKLARTQLIRKIQGGVKRHAQVSWRREWREGDDPDDREAIEVESTTETVTEVEPDLKAIEFWLANKTDGEFQKAPKAKKRNIKPVQDFRPRVPKQFLEQSGSPAPVCDGVEVDLDGAEVDLNMGGDE